MGVEKRGFATMAPGRRKEIARLGGRSVDPANRTYSKNRKLAVSAGRKGGKAVRPEQRSFSQDRGLAAAAGRKGGKALPAEKRTFSKNPGLAARAGRQGGLNSRASAAAQALMAKNEGEGQPD